MPSDAFRGTFKALLQLNRGKIPQRKKQALKKAYLRYSA